jgi:threonine dehydratase
MHGHLCHVQSHCIATIRAMSITIADIHAAQRVLKDVILPTPLLFDDALSRELGAKIHLKAENLQRGGSFKVRGAYNKIANLSSEARSRGVIAHSAGNHAQGVAYAARAYGVPATIVMPEYAPLTKVINTRALGAQVVLHGATFDEAGAHSQELEAQHGFTRVHAFNDPLIIAGQGTLGLEVMMALPEVSLLVVPIGGGGLIGGIATAARVMNPRVRIVGVQASGCAAVAPSLAAGEPIAIKSAVTIADGIAVKRPGDLTLPIIQTLVDDVVEVSEDEIARGIAHCLQNARLVVEGAGAAGIGALLAGKVAVKPDDVVCAPLCGGNIDGNLLARVIEQVLVRQGRYMLLRMSVVDRPGNLAKLINIVAGHGANVIDVYHRRAIWLAPLGRVGIELVLEVRDEAHGHEVQRALHDAGYPAEREGVVWPESP